MTRKIVLITGASRGLGRNAALQLVARGFDLIGTYHSRQDEARAVADEVARLGGRAEMLQLDVGPCPASPPSPARWPNAWNSASAGRASTPW